MSLKALSRRRVASPPVIPTAEINRPPTAAPHLWPNLSPETQAQIARILAELLQRMLPMRLAPGKEISRVDRREPR